MMSDRVNFYGQSFSSRFLIGSALYPSPEIMAAAITASQAEIITVSLRRQSPEKSGGESFWDFIKNLGFQIGVRVFTL